MEPVRRGISALAHTASSAVVVVGLSSFNSDLYINYAAVPEPGNLLWVGLAGLGFAGYRRHKRRATGIREGELNDNAALVDPGIVE